MTWVQQTGSELTGNLMVLSLWGVQLEAGKTGVSAGSEWALPEEWLLVQPQGRLQIRLNRLHFLCSGRLDTA